jgi:hypothetical protein
VNQAITTEVEMKILYPVFLLFAFIAAVSGQTFDSVIASNVEVIQKQWRVEKYNPMLERNPLQIAEEMNQAEVTRRQSIRQANRGQPAIPPDPTIIDPTEIDTASLEVSTKYVYEVKVKNNSVKEIQSIIWDYVFSEPGTEKEVGRRRFISRINISPGKTKNLQVRTAFPPTGAINAKNADKKLREQYAEKIVIQQIQYADGSNWQAPVSSPKGN